MATEMKSPRSPLQIAASRANGAKSRGPVTAEGKRASAANSAKSTGPVTPEGKARSSRNATRHGLLAGSVVLHGQSWDSFRALLSTLESELHPEPGIESIETETMAVAYWRCIRLWRVEKAQFEAEMQKLRDATGGKDDASSTMDFARSFRTLADETRSLDVLNRYEARFSRQYLRALASFNSHREGKKRSSEALSEKRRRKKSRNCQTE
jgi:hypothetical protein